MDNKEDKKIYGVDLSQSFNAVDVRNAIITCFKEAHKEILESVKDITPLKSEQELEEIKNLNVKFLVEHAFRETGGEFNHPTKESLIEVVHYLKEYAAHFRTPEIINKHGEEIMQLIEKLKN